MRKKILFFLIFLFLISFIIRGSLAFLSPIKYWDETVYGNLGKNIFLYKEYSFLHGFADFSPDWPLAGFRPPLLPFLISLVYFFGGGLFVLNFLIPFISAVSVIGFFLFSKKLFGDEIAVYSSLFFA